VCRALWLASPGSEMSAKSDAPYVTYAGIEEHTCNAHGYGYG